MYEDLVKRLRKRSVNLKEKFSRNAELLSELMQAADAIEELTATAESYKRSMEAWADEAARAHEMLPRWIPVTERFPEDDRQVLAYYGFDHGDGYLGMMFVQVLDWFGHDPKPHFQHEGLNGMTVTHWMPLPEPPKEEKQ